MKVSNSIDWLQWTLHDVSHWWHGLPAGVEVGKQVYPMKNYHKAYDLIPAGRVHVANSDKQGALIILTGGQLAQWFASGITPAHIVWWLSNHPVSVSRMDFAVDVFEERTDWLIPLWYEIENLTRSKAFVSRMKPDITYGDKLTGFTRWFGSKTSEQRVRIYDKASEMEVLKHAMEIAGIIEPHWTRIELQARDKKANNLAVDMAKNGWEVAGKARIRGLLRFPASKRYTSALSGDSADLTIVPRAEKNVFRWLNSQVKPAILRRAAEDTTLGLYLDSWLRELAGEVRDIIDKDLGKGGLIEK